MPEPYDDFLGSGAIPEQDVIMVLRRVRHRVIALQTAQSMQTELVRNLSAKIDEQHTRLDNRIGTIEGRTFGYADDREGGAIGRLRNAQINMSRQNWAIILLLISVLAGVIATLATHH
jgi:hypothetical protein